MKPNIPMGRYAAHSFMSDASKLASAVKHFLDSGCYFYERPIEWSSVEVEAGPERGMIGLSDSFSLYSVYAAASNCRLVHFVDCAQRLAVHQGRNTWFWHKRQGKHDLIFDATGCAMPVDDFLRACGVFTEVSA